MLDNLKKNDFGYFELRDKPSPSELKSYYQDKYFQLDSGCYEKDYSEAEKTFFRNKLEQKYCLLRQLMTSEGQRFSLLDVGAGEGWALDFFIDKGWHCAGLDYSVAGCQRQNPHCLPFLLSGDLYESLADQVALKKRYDVLLLDNVLEHVLEPMSLLKLMRKLIRPGGILIVEVPNDCSPLQEYLLHQGHVSHPFWIVRPDHLSYFNRQGLVNLCAAAGWTAKELLADFPIDLNLLVEETNYVAAPATGKACHRARIELENLLHEISPEKTNALYRALADVGLGRQIIGFFRPEDQDGERI